MVRRVLVHVMTHAHHALQRALVDAWIVVQGHARQIARVVAKASARLHVVRDAVIPVKTDV